MFLKLLPLFEYICPKCRKEIKKNSHECSHCGEKFPLAIRVPPSFLKDPKKLEAYVHKHVFPRVSEFERNYLTKYFTTIFSDGFESGDFTAWTSVETVGLNTQTVVNDDKHHGTYSAKFTDPSGGTSGVYKTITAGTNFYLRAYVRFSSPTTTDGDETFSIKFSNGLPNWIGIVGVEYNVADGKYYWILYSRTGTTTVVTRSVSTFTLSTTTWYCLELHSVIHATTGEHQVWINGTDTIHITGQDTDNYGNIDCAKVGLDHRGGDTIYVDCVVVADAYIGPETGAPFFTLAFTR